MLWPQQQSRIPCFSRETRSPDNLRSRWTQQRKQEWACCVLCADNKTTYNKVTLERKFKQKGDKLQWRIRDTSKVTRTADVSAEQIAMASARRSFSFENKGNKQGTMFRLSAPFHVLPICTLLTIARKKNSFEKPLPLCLKCKTDQPLSSP